MPHSEPHSEVDCDEVSRVQLYAHYLNRVQSPRRLKREAGRNVEVNHSEITIQFRIQTSYVFGIDC